jgi:hypothetical protein
MEKAALYFHLNGGRRLGGVMGLPSLNAPLCLRRFGSPTPA